MLVVLVAVTSLDGFITRHDDPSTGWASPEDRTSFRELLATFDSSISGSTTFHSDGVALPRPGGPPPRLQVVLTSTPERYRDREVPGVVEFRSDTPQEVVADLGARGRQRCALLGGGRVYSSFLAAGLVDELVLTLEPKVFGEGTRWSQLRTDETFELVGVRNLNLSTLHLHYRRA